MKFDDYVKKIGPEIANVNKVPLIKEALTYQLFADRLHSFVCSPPSVGAKSSFRNPLMSLAPGFDYVLAGARATAIGISETAMRVGVGIINIDEVQKATPGERAVLYDLMQNGKIKIVKHNVNKESNVYVNVYATCNPKGDYWRGKSVDFMMMQLPCERAFLRRFHIPIILHDYSPKDIDTIHRHNVPPLDQADFDSLRQDIMNKRQIKVNNIKIPENIYIFLENLKVFQDYVIIPITPEIKNGIVQMAIARARSDGRDHIVSDDWYKVLDFFIKCLKTTGLTDAIIKEKMMS